MIVSSFMLRSFWSNRGAFGGRGAFNHCDVSLASRILSKSHRRHWCRNLRKVDCVVIGAGVVGLAVARELALAGREVIVLESTELIGSETSSRNSEVIHAGIYYPKDSLKALFCVEGKKRLYQYCADHGVPRRRVVS